MTSETVINESLNTPVKDEAAGDDGLKIRKFASPIQPVGFYRDPSDISLHRLLALAALLAWIVAFISIGMNFYLYFRKPDRIVAVTTPSGDRVVELNNRQYGATEAVQLGQDKLTNEDKRYLVSQWAQAMYGVDPQSRAKDIERAIKMFVPSTAVQYANHLKSTGILEVEKRESWQAVWKEQENKVDVNDPYLIRIIGSQLLTKVVNGQVKKEEVQYTLEFKLSADSSGRAENNLRTGFQIATFQPKELSRRDIQ